MKFDPALFNDREEGFPRENIAELNQCLQAPLSPEEIADLTERFEGLYETPPSEWQIRLRDLPASFVDLLAFSNGGGICNGEREIGYFSDAELREYLLEYQFPDSLPGCVPFGLNGGGVFYLFDMRTEPVDDEFPILIFESGGIDFEDTIPVATSLPELLNDPTDVEDLL